MSDGDISQISVGEFETVSQLLASSKLSTTADEFKEKFDRTEEEMLNMVPR